MKNTDDDTNEVLNVIQANKKAWNHWGRKWLLARTPSQKTTSFNTRTLLYRKVYLHMNSVIGDLEEQSVLDIGCGTSEYQKWLAQDSAQLCGLDISLEMLRLCRYDMGKSIALISGDAHNLPFRKGAFSVTTTFQALHHFPNWVKALNEMSRISRHVCIYEPNGDSIFHRIMHMIRLVFRTETRFKQTDYDYHLVEYHANGFSPTMISNMLRKNKMATQFSTYGLLPESYVEKISKRSRRLLLILLNIEHMISKIPIIRNQLGGMLIIGSRRS